MSEVISYSTDMIKSVSSECVKVIVRCRPMSEKEVGEGYDRVVDMHPERGVVEVRNPKHINGEPYKQFTFDAVFDWNAKQTDLYDEIFRSLVESVLEGFNGTIFAYGQTGTGKTYTMEGVRNDPERRGVIPNSFEHIFNHIARSQNQQYLVRASFLEIYQEEIRDLLAKDQNKRLELKERPDTGIYVKDLSTFVCKSVKEIEHVMTIGNQNRAVGATNMNLHSSRSHAIFIITIEHSELGIDGQHHIRVGKLNLVDLAGSERQAKTGAVGERQKEAIKINLSLSALGNVISALVDGKSSHIPYRDSKLTRLLQDSLGGNAKTIMVANIGPASYNYDETLITLRYANRAKNIKNKPRVNEDPKDALLREFQQEISRLKTQLASRIGKRKKKRHFKGDGTTDGEYEDVEIDSDIYSEEEFLKEQEAKLQEERKNVLSDQNLIAEEKEKLLNEMQNRQEQIRKEQDARDMLATKIKAMESKLLSGGKNIIDHTNEQQRALEQRRQEIAEQKRREREMLQKLEDKEEGNLEIKETFSSLQQEIEIKTKKLRKLFAKLQAVKAEIQDLQEEHSRERQELEMTQNELTKELKLKYLIIENFIPLEEKNKVLSRVVFDEDDDQWKLMPISQVPNTQTSEKRPVSTTGSRRPVSQYARMASSMGGNPRYKGENILQVELDMPNRTTRDYDAPVVAPHLQAALVDALREEDDVNIDASLSVFSLDNKIRIGRRDAMHLKTNRPSTGKQHPQSQQPDTTCRYPQPRGLVPK
ncbi:kinesin-II 95 kDa subunit-like isoform X2 [Centruroides vittatus]|uniref:kinesin-II 95 kDa subunit-like isoform X2 n=1 Tax=Centruroides vittatus TaxID=120091 RepID=UPI00351030AB